MPDDKRKVHGYYFRYGTCWYVAETTNDRRSHRRIGGWGPDRFTYWYHRYHALIIGTFSLQCGSVLLAIRLCSLCVITLFCRVGDTDDAGIEEKWQRGRCRFEVQVCDSGWALAAAR
jgi:hypothetical protein